MSSSPLIKHRTAADEAHAEMIHKPGPLAWFVHNHVASNLLMLVVLGLGLVSLVMMQTEVFPAIDRRIVSVSVQYRGASPLDVEQGVCRPIEEAVAGIDGVKRVTSVASEGYGVVRVELEDYANMRTGLNDVKSAVDRIQTFPVNIDDPVIAEASDRVQVITMVVSGEVSERVIKTLAEDVREEIMALSLPERQVLSELDKGVFGWLKSRLKTPSRVTQVDITGTRRDEISIEVTEATLQRYGLTLGEVAQRVRDASLDLPAGSVDTLSGKILVRTKGQRYTGRAFEDVVIRSNPDGTLLRLHELAVVRDTFEDNDLSSYYNDQPAAMLKVFRVGDQNPLEIAALVKNYAKQRQATLPAGVSLDTWFDRSTFLQGRIDLLVRNGYVGLILVFICLTLFLDLRLAFWTTLGIPISFMGAFLLMPYLGVSVNMISLFALIVVLGIVVDDAIVVGENIFAHRQRGMSPMAASICGVREMAIPVTFAVLTTMVAFLPLMFTAGEIGKIVYAIPIVVICVLLISLVEGLLILPAHLAGAKPRERAGWLKQFQIFVNRQLQWVVKGPYLSTLQWALRWRYVVVAMSLSLLLLIGGAFSGGYIGWIFFDSIDADNVAAELEMPQGTPVARTKQVVAQLEAAYKRVQAKLDAQYQFEASPSIFKDVSITIGDQPLKRLVNKRSGGSSGGAGELAEINIAMVSSEERTVPSREIAQMWREEVGEIPGITSLSFLTAFFSAGAAVHVELAHDDFDALEQASDALKAHLKTYAAIFDIEDDLETGKRELKLSLTEAGRTLGLTLEDLSRQVRSAFYGVEVQRVQRGREDMRVMVRYPESARQSLYDIEKMRLTLPNGEKVAFKHVAQMKMDRGYAVIQRSDRRRVVAIKADADKSKLPTEQLMKALKTEVLPDLQKRFPGLGFNFEGEQSEQQASLKSLSRNFVFAMMIVFVLLGVQFRSYAQPLIIMSAIPFGLVGAVIGHMLLGIKLSFLSGFGVVALTGVVVNDSLIMIDLINQLRSTNMPLKQILLESGRRRFRPILLTTLTTFCGLTPMLLERSIQAKFLVPMAVSLAFGVLFATLITLILVPVLYAILEDFKRLVGQHYQPEETIVDERSDQLIAHG